jgi:hypothetical protein
VLSRQRLQAVFLYQPEPVAGLDAASPACGEVVALVRRTQRVRTTGVPATESPRFCPKLYETSRCGHWSCPNTRTRLSTMIQQVAVVGARGHADGAVVNLRQRRRGTPIACDRDSNLELALRDTESAITCCRPWQQRRSRPRSASGFPVSTLRPNSRSSLRPPPAVPRPAFSSCRQRPFPGGLASLLAAAAVGTLRRRGFLRRLSPGHPAPRLRLEWVHAGG